VIECLQRPDCQEAELNIGLGSLFFDLHGLVQKEELLLFPAASEILEEYEYMEMQKQSQEYGFPFIERPEAEHQEQQTAAVLKEGYFLKTETGVLDLEQILQIFNTLPVDMTMVDENNKVRFFTRPKDRIFPRSPAIIGRNVENCHPPESVHVVNEIIESFRAGKEDSARFWIGLKGKKIMIQYFALRDSDGRYKGVLEVSQDITEIVGLEGERRLLHWEK
jgi:PAS domain S-box-containing protein